MSPPPFEAAVRPDDRLGVVEFQGLCEGTAIIQAMDTLFGDADWDLSYDSLWDFGGAESMDIQIHEIEAMMRRSAALTAKGQRGRLGVVLRKKDYLVLGKLLSVRMEMLGRRMEIFECREAAETWLRQAA